MTPSDYRVALASIEREAEKQAMAARAEAGFEFVGLMDVGGEVFHRKAWRPITSARLAHRGNKVLLTLTDGVELLADAAAMRRYRTVTDA